MLPLFLPWFEVILLLAGIVFSFCKKWKVVFTLIIIAIIVNWRAEVYPLNICPSRDNGGNACIKVMCFNIDGTKEPINNRAVRISNLIFREKPEILFVSELGGVNKSILDSLLSFIYPYSLYSEQHCFYSKYPLSERARLGNEDINRIGVFKTFAFIERDTIVLYGCHFASNNYTTDSKYITPDSINNHTSLLQYISDIKIASSNRIREAKILAADLTNNQKPVIVLGDMNDVGGSKTIRQIESVGFKDAWWEGGFGYGATIHKPLPYRIDHILYSGQFKLNRAKVVNSDGLSDHDAVFAEFSY
jgi:exonuclease III